MPIIRRRSGSFAFVVCLGVLSGLLGSGPTRGDEPTSEKFVQILDHARMIDPAMASTLEAVLLSRALDAKIPVLIETVDSLNGETIREAINKKEFEKGLDGLFVLLAKKEHRIEVRVSKRFAEVIGEADQKAIRDAFIEGLKTGNSEAGIAQGIRAIDRMLRQTRNAKFKALEAGSKPDTESPKRDENQATLRSPLVVRNQLKLALSGAKRIIEGAEAQALEMGLKANIAVVDDGGHLLTFVRMDGGRPASAYTAITKATSAATFRQETGPLPRGTTAPDPLLNIGIQNAAAASGGKVTTLFGGVPIIVDNQVIGAVGVGGGTGEQDAVIAKAGIEAFLRDLKATADR